MKKSGVSDVVATVIIIALVIVAITVVWVGIMPLIKDKVGSSDICNDADVSIETSQGFTCIDNAQKIISIQVHKGSNKVNLSGLKFLLSNSNGNSVVYTANSGVEQTSAKVFYLNISTVGSNISSIGFIPILKDGKNLKKCAQSNLNTLPNCNLGLVESFSAEKDCFSDSDCEDALCQSKYCNIENNRCEYSFLLEGLTQASLCNSPQKCDGGGNCVQCLNAGECPTQECKDAMCSAGVCGFVNSAARVECGAGLCDGNGNCVKCLQDSDCPTQACKSATCSSSGVCEYSQLSSCNLYYENFDGAVDGWSHGVYNGGDSYWWYWGPSPSDSWGILSSNLYGDLFNSNTYGTNGNGCKFYEDDDSLNDCDMNGLVETSKLVSPEIHLSEDYSNFELDFNSFARDEGGKCLNGDGESDYGWYDGYDRKEVGVSTDGGEKWTALNDCWPMHSYNEAIWKLETFDLSAYRGKNIRLVFVYNSRDNLYGWGWDVDDVLVRGFNNE